MPGTTPTIFSLNPNSAIVGSPAFKLTVIGVNFVKKSKVQWNGNDLPTTFVSITELTANIPASDINRPGAVAVTVCNPTPHGNLSNMLSFTISKPDLAVSTPPRIVRLVPDHVMAGGESFLLTTIGKNFVTGSVVRWNNDDRKTRFISPMLLVCRIPASDIRMPGISEVRVLNPPPLDLLSEPLFFRALDFIDIELAPGEPAPITAGSRVIAHGTGFADTTIIGSDTQLGDTTVDVLDGVNPPMPALLFRVSPTEVEFEIPPGMPPTAGVEVDVKRIGLNVGFGFVDVS